MDLIREPSRTCQRNPEILVHIGTLLCAFGIAVLGQNTEGLQIIEVQHQPNFFDSTIQTKTYIYLFFLSFTLCA
ncbi:hypothetical protein AAFF_G00034630 [Aldrovandia affinis]|uniref:Uncharacterized protein n=1 Tax=Aldrovandia affinis TaxID=143900 RepID=A0AAD7WFJ8_9TELE|nr:hypothetical protein AAFF_G00034630 [Aldrovandia affinis]